MSINVEIVLFSNHFSAAQFPKCMVDGAAVMSAGEVGKCLG